MSELGGNQASVGKNVMLAVMMFLEFFVWGAWYVTMGPYMANQGPAWEASIANAYTLAPIAAILSPFFLGVVADRFFPSERVLGMLQLLGAAFIAAAPWAGQQFGPNGFIAAILLHTLCFMPTLGLTNTVAFNHIAKPETWFPIIRVLGTIGWIVAGLSISLVGWDTSANMFYLTAGVGAVFGVYSFFLPHTPAPLRGQPARPAQILGLDALKLLKDRNFAVFCVCSLLLCIPLAGYYAFAATFIGEKGIERIAGTMSLGQMSEVLFMLIMPLCFVRLGVKWMLAIGMLAWVARYGLFGGAAPMDESAAALLPLLLGGILLHGICYDFFFVTGQIYTDKKAPTAIRGQAQGFLVLITQGLGMLIGAQLFGLLRGQFTTDADDTNWQMVWFIPAAFAGAVLLIFVLFFKNEGTGKRVEADIEDTGPTPTPGGEPAAAP